MKLTRVLECMRILDAKGISQKQLMKLCRDAERLQQQAKEMGIDLTVSFGGMNSLFSPAGIAGTDELEEQRTRSILLTKESNVMTLGEAILKVLDRPMGVKEIAAAVQLIGYKSHSHNFQRLVSLKLKDLCADNRVKRARMGVYAPIVCVTKGA